LLRNTVVNMLKQSKRKDQRLSWVSIATDPPSGSVLHTLCVCVTYDQSLTFLLAFVTTFRALLEQLSSNYTVSFIQSFTSQTITNIQFLPYSYSYLWTTVWVLVKYS